MYSLYTEHIRDIYSLSWQLLFSYRAPGPLLVAGLVICAVQGAFPRQFPRFFACRAGWLGVMNGCCRSGKLLNRMRLLLIVIILNTKEATWLRQHRFYSSAAAMINRWLQIANQPVKLINCLNRIDNAV
jgi:hypothetical protein